MKKHQDKHHRLEASNGGGNTQDNISCVNSSEHVAWHIIFKNYHAKIKCQIINETWLDPDYKFICVEAEKYDEVVELLRICNLFGGLK